MARRFLLFLLLVLCFGLAVPALAVPGTGGGGGNDNGQGGGPPTTSDAATTTTAAATTTTTTVNGSGNGSGNGNGNDNGGGNGNGQGAGPPTTTVATTTTAGNSNGRGNGNGGVGAPTTTTATTTDNGNGIGSSNGQGGGPPTTLVTATTTGNGNGNGNSNGNSNGNGNGNGTPAAGQAPVAPVAVNGRVATFLAAPQIPVESDTGSAPPPTIEGQSAPERMISWLLSGTEQRFLPIVASPFVALMVVGRALTSAGSGAIAPVVLLGAVGFTKLLDRRRAKSLVPIAFLP